MDQAPDQPPPPYPGSADKAYPPGSAPYPPQAQQPGYPPAGPQAGQPGYPPGQPGYPPQPAPAGYPPQPASYQQPYPQQGGYPAGRYPAGPAVVPPPGGTQTVVVTQPHTVTTVVQHFGDAPSNTKCPNCQNQVTTLVSHEPGTMAWLACFLMFIFGFWLCCCIPFCVDGMQNAIHHCPVCKYRIATYNR